MMTDGGGNMGNWSIGAGLTVQDPGKDYFRSETVVAIIVSYWNAIRGPTHSMIFLEERTQMEQEELDFLGRFALLSAVAHDEQQGISFTTLKQLEIGVTSVLFQALCPTIKQDVQYCLSVVVRDECINRYVSLSPSVNERLELVVSKLKGAISTHRQRMSDLMDESMVSIGLFLRHLSVWMRAVVPPFAIEDTIFGWSEPLPQTELDFIAAAVTAHCTCHQRSLIVSAMPATIDKWIKALCLMSAPEVAHFSLCSSTARKKRHRARRQADDEGSETNDAAAWQGLDEAAQRPGYTPDLYIQGLIAGEQAIDKSEVQLSRYPPCVIDVDNMMILWPSTVCERIPLRHTRCTATQNQGQGGAVECELRDFDLAKPAQFVRDFVMELDRMDRRLRGGYAAEWRRWLYRRAASVVWYVNEQAVPETHEPEPEQQTESVLPGTVASTVPESTAGHGQDRATRSEYYLNSHKTRAMQQLLNLPTNEDLNLHLAAAESLCPGTYSKVCGDPYQVAAMDRYLARSLGVG